MALDSQTLLISPLAETAELFKSCDGRGIAIPSHEGEWLVIALETIELSGGPIRLESRGYFCRVLSFVNCKAYAAGVSPPDDHLRLRQTGEPVLVEASHRRAAH